MQVKELGRTLLWRKPLLTELHNTFADGMHLVTEDGLDDFRLVQNRDVCLRHNFDNIFFDFIEAVRVKLPSYLCNLSDLMGYLAPSVLVTLGRLSTCWSER